MSDSGLADPDWAAVAARFQRPVDDVGRPLVYLCGHSLGLAPVGAVDRVDAVLRRWAAQGVEGHFGAGESWYRYDEPIAEALAPLVGAAPDEVALMGTLTTNLHLLLASFFQPAGDRRALLIEQGAFPSDRYVAETHLRWHGLDPAEHLLEWPTGADGLLSLDALDDVLADRGSRIATALLGGVNFHTGQALDLAAATERLHAHDVVAGFDLAHAAGNLDLDLAASGADFAAWCSYKYLCGGPGAVAAVFVAARHGHDTGRRRLGGWWGIDPAARFDTDQDGPFVPVAGARGWRQSNPPILSLAPLAASLAEFGAVGMPALARRGRELARRLRGGLADHDAVEVFTPSRHGAQVSVRVADAAAVARTLRQQGIVVDVRPPDVIRMAAVPLYCDESDVDRVVQALVSLS